MTPISKKYLHDKLVLLLVTSNLFLAFLSIVLVFLRINIGQGSTGYTIQYRSNLAISPFAYGGISGILAFAVFSLLVAVTCIVLSTRTYTIRRELALSVLAAGIFLLLPAIIVSNALLVLH